MTWIDDMSAICPYMHPSICSSIRRSNPPQQTHQTQSVVPIPLSTLSGTLTLPSIPISLPNLDPPQPQPHHRRPAAPTPPSKTTAWHSMEAIAACSSASLARTLASLSLPRSRVRVRVPERRGRGRAVVAATASTGNYVVPLDAAPSGITRPLVEILRNLNKPVPEIIILPTSRRASASDPVIPWYRQCSPSPSPSPLASSRSTRMRATS